MNIDRRTLAELATRLKVTSDAAAQTGHHLASMHAIGDPSADAARRSVISINNEIAIMQRILNVLWLRSMVRPPGSR
jgi:hypothetical protein